MRTSVIKKLELSFWAFSFLAGNPTQKRSAKSKYISWFIFIKIILIFAFAGIISLHFPFGLFGFFARICGVLNQSGNARTLLLIDRANGNEAMMPRYLLLLGDGSYDNKNFTPGNTNLIPTFQSENSLSPVLSYVSDDYFGLLSDDEGEDYNDLMDIGVGRIVAKNIQEASSVINKIRKYVEIQPQTFTDDCSVCGDNISNFGAWRNEIAFVADYDGNSFISDSRQIDRSIDRCNRLCRRQH